MLRRVLVATMVLAGMIGAAPAEAAPMCHGEPATIVGTDGDDTLQGTAGDDVIVARGGTDEVFARSGSDTICGGGGRDRVLGSSGSDYIDGAGGHDRLSGGRGGDRVRGGPGSDALIGGPSSDRLQGGDDDDRFFAIREESSESARNGDDSFEGGGGADLVSFLPDPPASWINYPAVEASLITGTATGAGNDSLDSIRDLVALPESTLVGDDLGNFLSVYGAGTIEANGGADVLSGGSVLDAAAGDDLFMSFITGTRPSETALSASAGGEDPVRVAQGGSGDDTFRGGLGAETFFGGPGNDEAFGEDPDHFSGVGGDDELHGGPGKDTIEGNTGDDQLFGDEDNDVLDGGIGGADHIDGGDGIDLCTNGETVENCEPVDV